MTGLGDILVAVIIALVAALIVGAFLGSTAALVTFFVIVLLAVAAKLRTGG